MEWKSCYLSCLSGSTITFHRAEITAAPSSSNTSAFSPPPGIRGLRGPFSARKLLPLLSDWKGKPSPRQRAPPQLGPEKVQGGHLLHRAQDHSRHLHQSRRRWAADSPKFPNIAFGPQECLPIPPVFEPWLKVFMHHSGKKSFLPSTGWLKAAYTLKKHCYCLTVALFINLMCESGDDSANNTSFL